MCRCLQAVGCLWRCDSNYFTEDADSDNSIVQHREINVLKSDDNHIMKNIFAFEIRNRNIVQHWFILMVMLK